MFRIAIAGYQHESNSFAKVPASLDKWVEAGILHGQEIVAEYENSKATIAGILARLREEKDIEIFPLVFSRLMPMAPLTAEATDHLMNEILQLIESEGPWDAVFLPQHGAAVSEKYLDADGELVERVRALVGPNVIIGTALDFHANLSQKVVANSDIVKVYQTNPHLDTFERAFECADLVMKCLSDQIHPTSFLAMPPLIINILQQGTDDQPLQKILTLIEEEKELAGVLSISVVGGYPYADVPQMGTAFLVITDNNLALAESIATRISKFAWEMRKELNGIATPVAEALTSANALGDAPVVLFDVGDNVGAGTPGDSTIVLHEARRLGISGLLQAVHDPEIVAWCIQLGIGARIQASVGGKTDDMHGTPFPITGTITAITDGKYSETKPSHGGFLFYDDGPSAAIKTDDGQNLLLTSLPAMSSSLLQFRSAGLEPLNNRIIVVKGVHAPRGAYEKIAKKMFWLATAGASTADLSNFTYSHRRIPMYPFELDTKWS